MEYEELIGVVMRSAVQVLRSEFTLMGLRTSLLGVMVWLGLLSLAIWAIGRWLE